MAIEPGIQPPHAPRLLVVDPDTPSRLTLVDRLREHFQVLPEDSSQPLVRRVRTERPDLVLLALFPDNDLRNNHPELEKRLGFLPDRPFARFDESGRLETFRRDSRAEYMDLATQQTVLVGDPLTQLAVPGPTKVLDLGAAPGNGVVDLSWRPNPGADNVDHYEVQRRTGPTIWTTIASPTAPPTVWPYEPART